MAVETVLALVGIFEPGTDGGDIAEARYLAAGAKAQLADIGRLLHVAFDRYAHRAQAGIDRACRIDIVLALDGVLQIEDRQAALGERLGRDVDIDLLRLVADDDGLLDARRRQQHVARLDREFLQFRIGIAVAADRMQRDEGIAELVVEIGAEQALRQLAGDVADLLAHLVEGIRHFLRIRVALDLQGDDRAAGPRIGLDPVDMRRFLQLALDLVDDLVFHFLDGSAGPDRLHDHDAEGEFRVLALAHAHQAEHAGDDDQPEEEAGDARMPDRPARQIEGPLLVWWRPWSCSLSDRRRISGRSASVAARADCWSGTFTFRFSLMNCVPAETTRSPVSRPSVTSHAVAGEIGDLDVAGMDGRRARGRRSRRSACRPSQPAR